ncbi:MAG: hypothetical protein IJ068_04220 [Bacilli bacterium]|nr:hypothetical protein [Bacilli bacterium]
MKILNELISSERSNYKCFDLLKKLFIENTEFRNIIIEGTMNHKIFGFTDELWTKIHDQNIRGIDNFESVFRDGANIGYCTVAARQLSYSIDNPYICGGTVKYLINTPNSIDGSHTWILNDNYIIDTTFMLIIDKEYANKLGYIEENRYNPNIDPIYNAAKDFTLDTALKRKR